VYIQPLVLAEPSMQAHLLMVSFLNDRLWPSFHPISGLVFCMPRSRCALVLWSSLTVPTAVQKYLVLILPACYPHFSRATCSCCSLHASSFSTGHASPNRDWSWRPFAYGRPFKSEGAKECCTESSAVQKAVPFLTVLRVYSEVQISVPYDAH